MSCARWPVTSDRLAPADRRGLAALFSDGILADAIDGVAAPHRPPRGLGR